MILRPKRRGTQNHEKWCYFRAEIFFLDLFCEKTMFCCGCQLINCQLIDWQLITWQFINCQLIKRQWITWRLINCQLVNCHLINWSIDNWSTGKWSIHNWSLGNWSIANWSTANWSIVHWFVADGSMVKSYRLFQECNKKQNPFKTALRWLKMNDFSKKTTLVKGKK